MPRASLYFVLACSQLWALNAASAATIAAWYLASSSLAFLSSASLLASSSSFFAMAASWSLGYCSVDFSPAASVYLVRASSYLAPLNEASAAVMAALYFSSSSFALRSSSAFLARSSMKAWHSLIFPFG